MNDIIGENLRFYKIAHSYFPRNENIEYYVQGGNL